MFCSNEGGEAPTDAETVAALEPGGAPILDAPPNMPPPPPPDVTPVC